ncbi:MAG: FAD-dependent oxidoreductase, partial [Pirellula sp.]
MTIFVLGLLGGDSWGQNANRLSGPIEVDIVVYGGTSGGVVSAVSAARLGKSVVLIEPTGFLGGMTTGGLGATDIGNKRCIGGISREFYRRIFKHYQDPAHWKQETREKYFKGRTVNSQNEDSMWTFEPHVASLVFDQMVKETHVQVVFKERLDLKSGVVKTGTKIASIRTESGK